MYSVACAKKKKEEALAHKTFSFFFFLCLDSYESNLQILLLNRPVESYSLRSSSSHSLFHLSLKIADSYLDMVCPEQTTNWIFDYGLIEDISFPDTNFSPPASGFTWSTQDFNGSPIVSAKIGGSLGDSDGLKEVATKKRSRLESSSSSSSAPPSSKACREKQRRDKLNDKFIELGAILEPGRPPKTDKGAILMDAVRIVTQLKGEARKLKETNSSLQEKIKELKVEKIELRDEKQRLKAEKERLELQVKSSNFMVPPPPTAMPAMFAAHQGQVVGNKMVPVMSYPTVAMWQFMPSSAVDTSRDHVLHPPVA